MSAEVIVGVVFGILMFFLTLFALWQNRRNRRQSEHKFGLHNHCSLILPFAVNELPENFQTPESYESRLGIFKMMQHTETGASYTVNARHSG